MTQRGRRTTVPTMVHKLDGSEHAKLRLETILRAVAGEIGIPEACRKLGIEPAHFHRLRDHALQAALGSLEPRPAGRPPSKPTEQDGRAEQMGAEINELRIQLFAAQTREEIALAMPGILQSADQKKKRQRPKRRTTRGVRSTGRDDRPAADHPPPGEKPREPTVVDS